MKRATLVLMLLAACSGSSSKDGQAGTGGGAGTSGAAGTSGGAGTTGVAGTSGPPGTSGVAGTTGSAGTTGAAGTTAPDGGAPDAKTDARAPFTGTVKMMVVGSSNEESTCWRAFLWQKLRNSGITDFDFVGRNNAGPDCGVAGYDKDSEAHGGTVVGNITADAWAATFASKPDIILQHNGGADLLNGKSIKSVLDAYTLSVQQARKANPKVIWLAGQHTPQGNAANVADVVTLNDMMVPWAAALSTPESPVVLVDLFTGVDQKTDTSDNTHLNVAGSQKVSDRFLAALLPFLEP